MKLFDYAAICFLVTFPTFAAFEIGRSLGKPAHAETHCEVQEP